MRNASSTATPQPSAVDPSPTITRRYLFLSSPEGDADGCVLPVMALHGPGGGKRRRGSLDDVTRGGCVTAPERPAALEVRVPLALPPEDGKPDESAGGLSGLVRGKRRRGTGLHGTNNHREANGLHAVALPAGVDDGAVDAFVNQTDVVHDALLSALGGRMSASAKDVQAYVAFRRAPYGEDRNVMSNAPDCARTVKRLLYCSDRFRVVRKHGSSLGPASSYEFQLARSGGSVPRTLSMQQHENRYESTPPPANERIASQRSRPTGHGCEQEVVVPAIPEPQLSGPETAAVDVSRTTDVATSPSLGEGLKKCSLLTRTCSDGATSKVTTEVPEDKTAAGQSTLDDTRFTRVPPTTTASRGDASSTDVVNINALDGLKAGSGLSESLVGDGTLDFSSDLYTLLPAHAQGLPLLDEAEAALSEQLLNFREWDTSFG